MGGNIADFLETRRRSWQGSRGEYEHWLENRDDDDVLWLTLDRKDSNTNTLNATVLSEFDTLLDSLTDNPPKALVVRSQKRNGFCAGADIGQFSSYGADDIRALLERGHRTLDRLEKLPFPAIAVVHGHCLGGGLELALACSYRIGVKGSLQMGFPEIQLGLHPGLGGTFRLIELIDPLKAMTMMLTGSPAHDGQTLSRGLVDELVEERHIRSAVDAAVARGIKPRRGSARNRLLITTPVRKLAAKSMRERAGKKAPAKHYPAPGALIDLWVEHGDDRKAMQTAEIDSFARLIDSDTSKNLVRVFFLREGLKQTAKGESDIRHVHVIGAGAMGGDIAAWCALQRCQVTVSDVKREPIAAAVKSAVSLCRSRHRTSLETRDTLDRLTPDLSGKGIARADLIIEAVPENLDLKKKIYEQVEPLMKKNAILATNTSSIPLEKLAAFLHNPTRLVGIHFFNPVARMLIVEVVSHKRIDEKVRRNALAFTNAIGKLPVAVQSYPGFAVNRALTPYLLEAVTLLDEGVDKETIDKAARDFGMPVGPVELADQVGLDVCLEVAEMLETLLDRPLAPIPGWMKEKVEKGDLGRKSGQGFYSWKDGKAQRQRGDTQPDQSGDETLTDRLILPMLDACVECLRKSVVADSDQLDATMIFATGFAPFRGGPMHYARSRGIDEILSSLDSLEKKHGERFRADTGWRDL